MQSRTTALLLLAEWEVVRQSYEGCESQITTCDPAVSDTRKSRIEKIQQLPKFKQLSPVEASGM
ncbi:hypothetical protein PF003_g1477 [Phytophthora fragariae]|nr:hypothetical protein PF003_g1477 [Phytophthora fragariae]